MRNEFTSKLWVPEEINHLTEKIIGCSMKVSSTLGPGFLEKIYENALAHELRKAGLEVEQQAHVEVWYDEIVVGDYYPDLFVSRTVLVELKTVPKLSNAEFAQCMNYLRATGLPVCLLLNFGRQRLEFNRFSNPQYHEIAYTQSPPGKLPKH